MKSILKEKNIKFDTPKVNFEAASQSASIGAVRWTLPDQDIQAHSSAPAPAKSSSATKSQGLRDLRSLQECVKFITQWKEQVDQVCKHGSGATQSTSRTAHKDATTDHSLEECRRLILEWAEELKRVDMVFSLNPYNDEDGEQDHQEKEEDSQGVVQQRIMEWAKELQTVSESYGVPREELAKMLRHLEVRKRKLVNLFPFLEFITWCLLKEDSKASVPQIWLLAKQRTWKAGTPKYIPNSVWNWIRRASAEVTLDPMTNHRWLLLSDDRKKVQEALSETEVPFSKQRFDSWPCVLGWEGFSCGRHYWEVTLANKGYWRLGVTTASSKRHGRFPMTPAAGYWTLWRSTRQFYACTQPETVLPVGLVPHKVGVYLDYEEGQISFYNVDTKTHIFTFSDTFRESLYPLFAPLDGRTLITVSCPKSDPQF
ncbi:E3 ubiquitin-protein ligase TRIM39 [Scleropages formosus]|uniref:E3 ubiquitin-protein ligase TRIM39 n=1 Tax=Scleropages formosus TaxID=113540 RepID=UPI0010FAB32F|nr:E3 ubiquitin-protein ligase TRIM39-like [Scleropages formosus]